MSNAVIKKENWWGFFLLSLILIGNAFFLRFNAFRGFNSFDMCFSLEGGWRIFQGQRPHVDYLYFNTPLHYYLNALFFRMFGFGKTAILAHLLTTHSLLIVAVFLMARKYLALPLSHFLSVLTATSFYWPISFPWHDQTAHFWGILAIAVFALTFPFRNRRVAWGTGLVCGLMAMLSFLTKVNLGVIYGAVLLFVLLSLDQRKAACLGYAIGVAVGLVLLKILIPQPGRFIEQFFNFVSWDGKYRVSGLTSVSTWLLSYYWIPSAIVIYHARPCWRRMKSWLALLAGFTVLAIYSRTTTAIIKEAYVFLWGVYMTIVFVVFEQLKDMYTEGWRKRIYEGARGIFLLMALGMLVISVKYGLELKVWSYSGRNPFGDYRLKTEPLAGWMFPTDYGRYVDEIATFINQRVPPEETIFVGTDMTVLYPLTGRDPYRGVPLTHLFKDYYPRPGRELEEVRDNMLTNPPDWIVTDYKFLVMLIPYLGFQQEMSRCYILFQHWGPYALFKRVCPARGALPK